MSKYTNYIDSLGKPIQPEKCVNCIWGRWEASKQYCSKTKCVKGEDNERIERESNTTDA